MDVKFGMLQKIKANAIKNNSYNQIANSMLQAENIFTQYNQYVAQLNNGNENNNENSNNQLSVSELEAKMTELEQKFNQYYAAMNSQKNDNQNNNSNEENQDKNNKVNFKGFVA